MAARPSEQGRLALTDTLAIDNTDATPMDVDLEPNRSTGLCERCGRVVPTGAGVTARFGTRPITLCHPHCDRAAPST